MTKLSKSEIFCVIGIASAFCSLVATNVLGWKPKVNNCHSKVTFIRTGEEVTCDVRFRYEGCVTLTFDNGVTKDYCSEPMKIEEVCN